MKDAVLSIEQAWSISISMPMSKSFRPQVGSMNQSGEDNKKKQNEKFRQLNIARENICSNLALVRGDILR